MEPEADRTCRRCSVARVNALVKAYQQAHRPQGEAELAKLRQVAELCRRRDYADGRRLLVPGVAEADLRALCWNVSSFLTDDDLKAILGVTL